MLVKTTFDRTEGRNLFVITLLVAAGLLAAVPAFSESRWNMRRQGNYLIIAAADYVGSAPLNELIDAKIEQGLTVTTHSVPSGTTREAVRSYIQSLWGTANAPDYILIVGDTDGSSSTAGTVPHWQGGASKHSPTDLPYACMDDGDDWYPDIAIGRWSCRTIPQLQDIVNKSLYVEAGAFDDPEYYKHGAFLANPDTYGTAEPTHDWIITELLEPAGYEGIPIYAAEGGDTQDVTNAVNSGVLFTVYMGHSGSSGWWDPSYYQNNVTALTNAGKYPLVCGWSCNTANYTTSECFGETWLRAANKGAIAYISASDYIYWGSVEAWRPSGELEKGFFRAIFEDGIWEVGPAWQAGLFHFLETYGEWDGDLGHPPAANADICRNFFEEFLVLGDPALLLPGGWYFDVGSTPMLQSVCVPGQDQTTYALEITSQGNFTEPIHLSTVGQPAGVEIAFTINDALPPFATEMSVGNLSGTPVGTYTIKVNATASVMDASTNVKLVISDDTPGPLVTINPPDLAENVALAPTLRWTAARQAAGYHVEIATDRDFSNVIYAADTYEAEHAAAVELERGETYYWRVRAENACEAGEISSAGSFTTMLSADAFTELFDGDFDLEYTSLTFTPDGSGNDYRVCREDATELPVDTSTGTILFLADDAFGTVPVPEGRSIPFYGVEYNAYNVGSNGYVTFTSGDTEANESPANHFDLPRISALFDDLNPDYGDVRFKNLNDRVAVGYRGVRQQGVNDDNWFEIEMFFDGRIRVTWLNIDCRDALVGLSRGRGVPSDYVESDLAAADVCDWHTPPVALHGDVLATSNAPIAITLTAADDGVPEPPALEYVIVTLPHHGTLRDPGAGVIAAVPYTLAAGGNQVEYTSADWYVGWDIFAFMADDGGMPPAGGASNTAAITIEVRLPDPQVIYSFPLDVDPGWMTEGQWAFGQPAGGGTHNYDPTSGATGANVYGYNLSGDYTRNMPIYRLTTAAIDCSTLMNTELRFQRWLGVERAPYDRAGIEVSTNGADWTAVWENPTVTIADHAWMPMSLDISNYADGEPTVYLRWSMGPTDAATTYPGWNIDDVEIVAIETARPCPGDLDGDHDVDLSDLARLLANYGLGGGATYEQGDLDGDGDVDLSDLAALLSVYGTEC